MSATIDRATVERLVREALSKHLGGSAPTSAKPNPLVVNISARHVHLTQEHVEILFGKGAELEPQKWLYQDGFFAAQEAVIVVESMKMEYLIHAPSPGRVIGLLVREGAAVAAGQDVLINEPL